MSYGIEEDFLKLPFRVVIRILVYHEVCISDSFSFMELFGYFRNDTMKKVFFLFSSLRFTYKRDERIAIDIERLENLRIDPYLTPCKTHKDFLFNLMKNSAKARSLKNLSIEKMGFVYVFSEMYEGFPSLESLSVSNFDCKHFQIWKSKLEFYFSPKKCWNKLRHLYLNNVCVPKKMIIECPNLQTISIKKTKNIEVRSSNNLLNEVFLETPPIESRLMEIQTKIKKFSLINNYTKENVVYHLDILKKNNSLKELFLSRISLPFPSVISFLPSTLQKLEIIKCENFRWDFLSGFEYPNLRYLELKLCFVGGKRPKFSFFNNLRILKISGKDDIQNFGNVGTEFCLDEDIFRDNEFSSLVELHLFSHQHILGNGWVDFPKLKKMELSSLYDYTGDQFPSCPNLEYLHLKELLRFVGNGFNLSSCLKLKILRLHSLPNFVGNLTLPPKVKFIGLRDLPLCTDGDMFCKLGYSEKIIITKCPILTGHSWNIGTDIKKLVLRFCPLFSDVLFEKNEFPNLKELFIHGEKPTGRCSIIGKNWKMMPKLELINLCNVRSIDDSMFQCNNFKNLTRIKFEDVWNIKGFNWTPLPKVNSFLFTFRRIDSCKGYFEEEFWKRSPFSENIRREDVINFI